MNPRVWIASPEYAGGNPQFLVVKPGYTVVGTIPIEGVAFSLDWAAASVLYLAGMTTPAAMSGDVIVNFGITFPYVPVTRVIGVTTTSDGKITNTMLAESIAYPDRLETTDKSQWVAIYYFVFTKRTG